MYASQVKGSGPSSWDNLFDSGFGTQSEYKQKQVEALTLVKSMKLEAQPIAYGVGG